MIVELSGRTHVLPGIASCGPAVATGPLANDLAPFREGLARDCAAPFEFIDQSGDGDPCELGGSSLQSHIKVFANGLPGELCEYVGELGLLGSEHGLNGGLWLWIEGLLREEVGKWPRPRRAQFITGLPGGDEGCACLLGHTLGELHHFL